VNYLSGKPVKEQDDGKDLLKDHPMLVTAVIVLAALVLGGVCFILGITYQ
jgi:hypothetical protein